MAKYLALCKYSQEAMKGVLKETASVREQFLRNLYESYGACIVSLHWTLTGEYTVAVIVEGPRDVLTAISVNVLASGALSAMDVIELLSAAEIDQALNHQVVYRPPGI